MGYEELLADVRKGLPKKTKSDTRFEVPKIRGHIQGNRTILSNFNQIATAIGRPVEHILKYILKELATPGEIKKTGVIIGSKVSAARINEKINQYVTNFVICPECGKPDTKITKQNNINFLKCQACGAMKPVTLKI